MLLGLSPGVLHTVLCAWRKTLHEYSEIIVLATSRETAEHALRLARSCPCPGSREPPLAEEKQVEIVTLSHADYDSIEAVEELRRILDRMAIGIGDAIDVTGGRKLAALVAGLHAAHRGALVGYSLIPSSEYRRLSTAKGKGCREETVSTPPRLIAPLP